MYANHRNPRIERSSRSNNPNVRHNFKYISPAERILRSAGRTTVERLEYMGVLPTYNSRNRSHFCNRRLNTDHDYNRRSVGFDARNVDQNQNFGLRNEDIPTGCGPTQTFVAQREEFGSGLNDLGNENDDVESLESGEVRAGDHEEVCAVSNVQVDNAVDSNEEVKGELEEKSLGEDVERKTLWFENVPTKRRAPQRRSRFAARNAIVEGEVDMDVDANVQDAETVQNLMNLPEPEAEVVEVVRSTAYKVCDLNLVPLEIIKIEDDETESTIYDANNKKLIPAIDLVEDDDFSPSSNRYCFSALASETTCSSSILTGNADSRVTYLEFRELMRLRLMQNRRLSFQH